MRRAMLPLLVWAGALTLLAPAAFAKAGYYRYADLNGDRIVFTAEDDLWLVPAAGGTARRITSHEGTEYFAKFSPDGSRIAFTGEYDGNRDVYVMPAEGGEPKRLTWHPGADEVIGWTPDGKKIIFRSAAEDPNHTWHLYFVSPDGGDPEALPIGWACRLSVDPRTGMWAFNRKSRETATWKRYRGGTAPDVWVGDPAKADFHRITDFAGFDMFPMWHDGRIYTLCDRGGTMNIWSMLPDGTDQRKLTSFDTWDARWPSMAPDGRIVFTLGADLHVFDPSSNTETKLDIDLPSDRVLTRVRYPDPSQYLTEFVLSPDGDRLAVVARGEIFSVPVEKGVTLPVTHGSGARERGAGFDPKGERLVYITDAPHEEEIRSIDAWGRGEPTVVKPAGTSGWYFPPVWSPDGKWVAYADQTKTLYVTPAGGGTPTSVDRGAEGEIRDYTWSPDGRWLAYSKQLENQYSSVFVYDTRSGKSTQVTGSTTSDYSPSWDPDGRYLYFLSSRATNPILGSKDWDNVEAKSDKVYLLVLTKDGMSPLARTEGLPPDKKDETKGKKKGADKSDKKTGDEDETPKPVTIDLDGIQDRVVELPVDFGNYVGLAATAKTVYYLGVPLEGFAEQPGLFEDEGPNGTLMAFDLEKKKAKPFLSGIAGFDLSAKAGKIAVMKDKGEIYVVPTDAPAPDDLSDAQVSLDGMVIDLDPRQEWEQIYYEGWRHERDFFWDPGMGGMDWKAIRDQYATLLPRITTRGDLQDLMGEVIGELGNSHTYVWGGDPGKSVTHVSTGLLGADVAREGAAYRVTRIYRGDPADGVRSPLREPGVNVNEGDYILAVNHIPFPAGAPFLAALENLAGKEVVLTVSDRASGGTTRDVAVKPTGSDSDLRYADWVRRNREYVAEKTGGKIGYVHIPDMWQHGLIEFDTWFYPQLDKEGMVVDARWNGGGAVSEMIVERLRRRLVSFDRSRAGDVSTYPQRVLNGPFVVLTNEFAGSDGDIFPAVIQLEKLAPVIGMRSWGGVVGIRGDKPLVDGGMLTQPEFAWWDPRGWAIENHGVDPDIEVQDMPQDLAKGIDAQLDRAISEVMKLHQEHPPVVPDFGPVRDRSRPAYTKEMTGQ
jgi:tricorn protease